MQKDLAEQFDVSRVAVRDALYKTVQRGPALKIPRKGIIVRPISCKIIRDITAMCRILEIWAAKDASDNMTDEDLEALNKQISIEYDKIKPKKKGIF